MWTFKSVSLFVVSLIVVILISMSMANANPVNKVSTWFENEKTKTIEFQKKSWSKTKEQWTDLITKFGLKGQKKND